MRAARKQAATPVERQRLYLQAPPSVGGKICLPVQLIQVCPTPGWMRVAWYTDNPEQLAWKSCLYWEEQPEVEGRGRMVLFKTCRPHGC